MYIYFNDYLFIVVIFFIYNYLYLVKMECLKKDFCRFVFIISILFINVIIWYKMNISNRFVLFYFEMLKYEIFKKYWKFVYILIFDNILNNRYKEVYFYDIIF